MVLALREGPKISEDKILICLCGKALQGIFSYFGPEAEIPVLAGGQGRKLSGSTSRQGVLDTVEKGMGEPPQH